MRRLQPTIARLRAEAPLGWALADQMVVSGGNFLTAVLLARHLGLSEFGVFALVWMAVQFAGGIQHALITSPLMSIGSKRTGWGDEAHLGALLVQQGVFVGCAMVASFVGVILFDLLAGGSVRLHLPLACAAGAGLLQDFVRRVLFARERAAEAAANDAVCYIGRLVVLVPFVVSSAPLGTAGALWIIAGTSAVAAAWGLVVFRHARFQAVASMDVAVRHWQSARWLVPSTLLQWTSGNLFLIATAPMLGTGAVGAIRAVQNLFGLTHILLQGLENFLPPRTAAMLEADGEAGVARHLGRWSGFCLVLAAAFGLVAVIWAEVWLSLFYGHEFATYGALMGWYAVIYLATFAIFPLRIGFRAVEHTRPIFISYAGATAFTVTALYPLIDTFALQGAMAGILGTQLVIAWVLWREFRSRFLLVA